jgi:hypothetical protein
MRRVHWGPSGPAGYHVPRGRKAASSSRSDALGATRLTHVAETLFGRDDDLARLDALWNDPKTNVVTLVAWGGVGKTSLVAKWPAT